MDMTSVFRRGGAFFVVLWSISAVIGVAMSGMALYILYLIAVFLMHHV